MGNAPLRNPAFPPGGAAEVPDRASTHEVNPATPSCDQARSPGSPGTILAIDNDPVALELLSRFLSREGFRVATARSGVEGLRMTREVHPAAILLDVQMPGMDGWTVLTTLKADPELASIPVIMVTMVDERTKGHALGVTDYLLKPIDRARLAAALKKLPNRKAPATVLIVEDDRANREILVRLMRKEGWSVIEADNGQAALARVAETVPNLILLDLMLPVMDGFAFVRELRKNPRCQATPVLVISAKELSRDERLQLSASVHKVIEKGTYSRDDLLREIRARVATQVPNPTKGTRRL
jgi:CheY-like chemotaxis protein